MKKQTVKTYKVDFSSSLGEKLKTYFDKLEQANIATRNFIASLESKYHFNNVCDDDTDIVTYNDSLAGGVIGVCIDKKKITQFPDPVLWNSSLVSDDSNPNDEPYYIFFPRVEQGISKETAEDGSKKNVAYLYWDNDEAEKQGVVLPPADTEQYKLACELFETMTSLPSVSSTALAGLLGLRMTKTTKSIKDLAGLSLLDYRIDEEKQCYTFRTPLVSSHPDFKPILKSL